jgi:uncharacterized protein YndB with AHSA1/START domain/DNA-binding transcriptional ArsR family regulator
VAFRIGKERERQTEVGYLGRRHDGFAAKRFCSGEIFGRIVDFDVERDCAWSTVLRCTDAAADAFRRCLNETISRPIAGILDLPSEQPTVEVLQLATVFAGHLEPRNCWLCHVSDPRLSTDCDHSVTCCILVTSWSPVKPVIVFAGANPPEAISRMAKPPSSRADGDDLVFRALADPTRRLLLDRLFDLGGQSLGELLTQVQTMTRFGVMKHLHVLESAGLVVTRRVGRQRLHYLNPVPLQLIHDRWVSKYTRAGAAALGALKAMLERTALQPVAQAPKQVYQIYIRATPEQIWNAITRPEFTAQYFYGSRVETNGRTGTPIRHYAPDGIHLWGDDVILESDPPRRLVHTWRSLYDPELAAEPPSRVTWEIDPQPGGSTKLTVVHDELDHAPKTAAHVDGGWMFILSSLKTLLETGTALGDRSTGAA